MDYKVVVVREECAYYAERELEKEVNVLLEDGWKLQGGISVSVVEVGYGSDTILAQAMTK